MMLVCVVSLFCWTQGLCSINKEGYGVWRYMSHSQLKTSIHGGDHPSLLGHSLCAVSCVLPRGKKRTGNCGGLVPSNHDSTGRLGCCQFSYEETGLRWRINMCPTSHPFADAVLMIQLQIRGKQQAGSQGWGRSSQEGAVRWATSSFIFQGYPGNLELDNLYIY